MTIATIAHGVPIPVMGNNARFGSFIATRYGTSFSVRGTLTRCGEFVGA